jgi:hypothetical protein
MCRHRVHIVLYETAFPLYRKYFAENLHDVHPSSDPSKQLVSSVLLPHRPYADVASAAAAMCAKFEGVGTIYVEVSITQWQFCNK